ncbi:MAG TPA: hypothetical protein VFT84_10865, partial [Gemmatimonadales bacterium]|nr:hypothetical protein [Gemmatimonadales bacterium]
AEAVDFEAESLGTTGPNPTDGSASGAVLLGWLERVPAPAAALRVVRAHLGPGGRALVVSSNPGSAVASVFHGRHWAGYDFPRSRALADRATLATLANQGGFTIAAVWTIGDPGAWTVSWGDLLRDWGAPAWIARALGPGSPLAASGARLLEWLSVRRGRGGLLVADLGWAPTVPASP